VELTTVILLCLMGFFVVTFIFLMSSIRIVKEDTRLSLYRLGRYIGDKGPGIVVIIPFIDRAVLKKLGEVQKTSSSKFSGDIGETRTTVYTDGKVLLAGEEWDAMSQTPISAGQRVRVIRAILEVEKE